MTAPRFDEYNNNEMMKDEGVINNHDMKEAKRNEEEMTRVGCGTYLFFVISCFDGLTLSSS